MKILFIGNSHTYFNDMPHLFERLWQCHTKETVDAFMLTHPGMDFAWHMHQYYEIRYNLLYGHYDYCIMQQAAHPFPGEETTLKNGILLAELCRKGNTKPVFTIPWSEKRYPQKQSEINRTFEKLSARTGAILSPVGKVWDILRHEHPEIELYWKDGEHASPYGTYVNACCHTAILSGKSVSGLPAIGQDFFQGIPGGAENGITIENCKDVEVNLDKQFCCFIQETVNAVVNGRISSGSTAAFIQNTQH